MIKTRLCFLVFFVTCGCGKNEVPKNNLTAGSLDAPVNSARKEEIVKKVEEVMAEKGMTNRFIDFVVLHSNAWIVNTRLKSGAFGREIIFEVSTNDLSVKLHPGKH
jgi:hypothetical protein